MAMQGCEWRLSMISFHSLRNVASNCLLTGFSSPWKNPRGCQALPSPNIDGMSCHTTMPSLSQCAYQRAGSTFTCFLIELKPRSFVL